MFVSIWKLTTGMTWVTPSPLSMTVPVSVLSPTCLDVQEAARASTACRTQKCEADHTLFSSAAPEDGVQPGGATRQTREPAGVRRANDSPARRCRAPVR